MLKFAVVREDPQIELALASEPGVRRVLVVASGGCTALSLKHALPGLQVDAFDANPDQLQHVQDKAEAIGQSAWTRLNIEDPDPAGLSQCGAFERLFRILRCSLRELVAGEGLERYFAPACPAHERRQLVARWTASPYWPAVFETAFNARLLEALFGPEATQHAEPGSYPAYFQQAFARGLAAHDGSTNPFLQSILLGCYTSDAAPAFLRSGTGLRVGLIEGGLDQVPELESYDLVHLSNIFDWCDDALVARWAELLQGLRPGARLSIRQLNNRRALAGFFASSFCFDPTASRAATRSERSLFYQQVWLARRTGEPCHG